MNHLANLFTQYGSDKTINGYADVYHALFKNMRNIRCMVEIGIGTMIPGAHSSMVGFAQANYRPGGSLRAWRDYFGRAEIIGVDVQSDTQFGDEPRIRTVLADSTKDAEIVKELTTWSVAIVIDDGSHVPDDQIKTMQNFMPLVCPGGF